MTAFRDLVRDWSRVAGCETVAQSEQIMVTTRVPRAEMFKNHEM